MELHVVIDDGEPVPGQHLTGTVYLHLTSYLPTPPPTPPTHLVDDDDISTLTYHSQLEDERLRLLSLATPSALERTELLDSLQLQIVGKCLPDASKIPKDVLRNLQSFTPDSQVCLLYSSPMVLLDSFEVPRALDAAHQPYTYRFSALLPPSLPPSYRGSSHRIVYFASVVACRHEKGKSTPTVIADLKVPFRVRVSDLHYRAFTSLSSSPSSPFEPFIRLPAALRTRVYASRIHPPPTPSAFPNLPPSAGPLPREMTGEAADARVVRLLQRPSSGDANARLRDQDASLPVPLRVVFPAETMQRASDESAGHETGRGHKRGLSLTTAAVPPSAPTPTPAGDIPALPPQLSPEVDHAGIEELLARYKRVQLAGDPLATTAPPYPPSPSTLAVFLTAIRTPRSFNIGEQSSGGALGVTLVELERSAFRPGDAVRGQFDFSGAVLPCYRVTAHLVWVEEPRVGGGEQATVVCSEHWYSRQAVLLPFSLSIPAEMPCNFATELVRGGWKLRFKFIVGTPRPPAVKKGGGWFGGGGGEKEEEEEGGKEREKGVGWSVYESEGAVGSGTIATGLIAPDVALDVSCLQWQLPLDVVPVYEEGQTQPSIKNLLIDVEER